MTGTAEIGALRQVIVKGRISEGLTRRGLSPSRVSLEIERADGRRRAVPAALALRDGGYYSLSMSEGAGLPEPPLAEALVLHLSVRLPDGREAALNLGLTGADLARQTRVIDLDGRAFGAPVIAGAPFVLDVVMDPLPVTLTGTLVADHDPARPIAGATVAIGPLVTLTDTSGRFRLTPLPVASPLTITVSRAGTDTDFVFHPDFTSRANSAALSLDL